MSSGYDLRGDRVKHRPTKIQKNKRIVILRKRNDNAYILNN